MSTENTGPIGALQHRLLQELQEFQKRNQGTGPTIGQLAAAVEADEDTVRILAWDLVERGLIYPPRFYGVCGEVPSR